MVSPVLVPAKSIGPVRIISKEFDGEVNVPLATFESPLWPSTNRGAKVSRQSNGIQAVILDDRMTRSVLVEAPDAMTAKRIVDQLRERRDAMELIIAATSRFAHLDNWHTQIVGNLIYLRLELTTGDAAGHNMVTKAADHLLAWLLNEYSMLKYVSVSGNFCVDKKVSAVNGILGRGKSVVAEAIVPREVVKKTLKTTPEKLVNLHIKKNLLGSIIAGGLRTANAHFANVLLGFYLATGQDVANIVEGSQGFVHSELRGEDLYFSVNIPNIILGTVGNGKELPFVTENLTQMHCLEPGLPGFNARKLAIILAATVWCGEISLLAAQTNPGELMRAHELFERKSHTENLV